MKTCLIVDDSRVMRKVARRILDDFHFEVDEAEEPMGALEACRKQMPDAILLDWSGLAALSGLDFLRALRREQDGGKPVVILCALENDVAQISEAVNAGANLYLLKPFDQGSLRTALSEAGLL